MKFEFEFIKKAFSENNGQPSSGRLFNGWVIFWFVLALTFGFVWVVIKPGLAGYIIAFAGILAGILIGILGIQTAKKNIEVNGENKNDSK